MSGRVVTATIERVRADIDQWPRHRLDQARVAEFVGLYRDDGLEALPAVDVVEDGEVLWLADGWHRYNALRLLRADSLLVRLIAAGEVKPAQAAYRHGLATAATTALPLNRAERRSAVCRLLTDSPALADREIARLVGVSPTTVGAHRTRLLGQGDVAGDGEVAEATWIAAAGADELASLLARSLDRIFEARGLTDHLLGDRTGRRLAKALVEVHGVDDALVWARRLKTWSESATAELGG